MENPAVLEMFQARRLALDVLTLEQISINFAGQVSCSGQAIKLAAQSLMNIL